MGNVLGEKYPAFIPTSPIPTTAILTAVLMPPNWPVITLETFATCSVSARPISKRWLSKSIIVMDLTVAVDNMAY